MKTNIFIPKKINVGYQDRKNTYTGKLAYIIYYDEKGKLRKETSWNNWRDENIPNEEFDNIPTSGFVLNKKAGDYNTGWSHRQAYCRVYDPRNFEFEITIENLLYILENTNSIKGKGLEGEFVYGWDGKDLILMPVDAPDYKEIMDYNSILHNNESIRAKDLIIGATYLAKNNEEYIYMGKHDFYSTGYRWKTEDGYGSSKYFCEIPLVNTNWMGRPTSPYEIIDYPYGKYFWFAYKSYDYTYVDLEKVMLGTYKWEFCQFKSIPKKLITCLDSQCSKEYSNIYESMIRTHNYSPRDYDNRKYIPYTFYEFVKYANIENEGYGNKYRPHKEYFSDGHCRYQIHRDEEGLWRVSQMKRYPNILSEVNNEDFYNRFPFYQANKWVSVQAYTIPMTIEELYKRLQPCYCETYLENGYLYERGCYYGDEE